MVERLRAYPEVPPSIHNTVWQAATGTRGGVESDKHRGIHATGREEEAKIRTTVDQDEAEAWRRQMACVQTGQIQVQLFPIMH